MGVHKAGQANDYLRRQRCGMVVAHGTRLREADRRRGGIGTTESLSDPGGGVTRVSSESASETSATAGPEGLAAAASQRAPPRSAARGSGRRQLGPLAGRTTLLPVCHALVGCQADRGIQLTPIPHLI